MVAGNPLLINVVDVRRVPGSTRDVTAEVELAGLELSSARVAEDSPLSIDLTLESVSGGVTAAGTITTTWQGECRRCLGLVVGELVLDCEEVFEDRPVEGETYPIEHDQIDLEPMVREQVLLSLPQNPLCSATCEGPIPEELPVLVADDDEGFVSPKDPRWAALDDLRLDG